MNFLRHMGVVVLIVAVIVLAGMAWNRFDPGSLVGNQLGGRQFTVINGHVKVPPGTKLPSGLKRVPGKPGTAVVSGKNGKAIRLVNSNGFDLGLSSMLDSVNWPVIRDTVGIEAGAMAAVIVIDVVRRRRRRARRMKLVAMARAAVARPVVAGPSSAESGTG